MFTKPHLNIPKELTLRRQFVVWRFEDRGGPKPTKVPYTCMGHKASDTNPEHWSEYEFAVKMAQRPGFCDGIGFVFSPNDPYCGIDLDNLWPSDGAETPSWAAGILERFADTYSEVSPSDKGIKIWSRAKAPRCGSWTVEQGGIEIYDHARFFAVTGRSADVLVITDHQHDIELLVANLDAGKPQQSRRIEGTIPYGIQHNTLVSIAGTLFRRGLCMEAIEAALLEVNKRQCQKPGPEENIRRIARSTARWQR
jgi:primase-polymerase (primpol)-like protein